MKDNKTESITLRTTKKLKKSLQQIADKQNRTLSNMIEVILEASIKDMDKKR